MEITEELGSSERILALRAAALHVPFAGTFELTPLCNMNCKMCYIRLTPGEMERRDQMLPPAEWIRIASAARDQGLLYLLLTGGEPLLYPGFDELYTWLGKSGIVVMLNTNGTMLTEERADLLLKYPPRKVNISLYGASRETYRAVCGDPEGFDRTVCAVSMLKERGIPVKLNCSLTPLNGHDLARMHRIADELQAPLQVTPYMFPPVRKQGAGAEAFTRFEPEEAARMVMDNARISLRDPLLWQEWIQNKLCEYENYKKEPCLNRECGFSCFASKNNFWITWQGRMLPCGMMDLEGEDVREQGFAAAWESIGGMGRQISNPAKCCSCDLRPLCSVCAAASMAETGAWDGCPPYLCRMTKELFRLLKRECTDGEIRE